VSQLTGRVALVTGASSGIGLAIATALMRAGATVACVSRHPASSAPSGSAVPIAADLSDESGVEHLLDVVHREFTRLDCLIHSAGVITLGRVQDLDVGSLDMQYRLNVRAPYVITRSLLPLLISGRGHIVFVNSSAGLVARAGTSQYAASKHALKALADSLRDEVHADGVRVLSIYPGRTATPMQERVTRMEGGTYNPEVCLQPEDVASIVMNALALPANAEVKDISIRPMTG
jgi:NADP-dependent 3-hydroxy acid dehydrogenase YdfG